MDYTALEAYVASQVNARRFSHCQSTANEVVTLVKRFNLPFSETEAKSVGIWHDVVRQWSNEDLLDYCVKNSLPVEEEEREDPMLLHGLVASHLFPYDQDNLKIAIRWHTLGSVKMGVLGAVLYIADVIEPLRTQVTQEERETILNHRSLEEMTLTLIELHTLYLERKGKKVASSTLLLQKELKKKNLIW